MNKVEFSSQLHEFVKLLQHHVSSPDGQWSVKGFIDVYKNLYTISHDTKIVSKVLEIHIFPLLLKWAESIDFAIVLAEKQNWYPDLSFVCKTNQKIKYAIDLKTTYRDLACPGHVNGFTLGSHGAYFRDRKSTKNIQYPYSEYQGHFCLGAIYTRSADAIDETRVMVVSDVKEEYNAGVDHLGEASLLKIDKLSSVTSVIRDFQFFACQKWQLASDRQGSGNTANIGSITFIDDIINGNGTFARLGEEVFDEYCMNYGLAKMKKDDADITIKRIEDFASFRKLDATLINRMKTKRKTKATDDTED
jgi:hypothetical protein